MTRAGQIDRGRIRSNRGFTLIEIIVSLIIVAILGSMLMSFGQKAMTGSANLVNLTRNTYNLETVMENINSDYFAMLNSETSILDDLTTRLNTPNYYLTGYNYTVDEIYRFNSFVDGGSNTLVTGSQNSNGEIMRLTIRDSSSGMTLTALFFDNNL
jgi:prepilin-type N-terminal cleavage/methylation domain-containing protein